MNNAMQEIMPKTTSPHFKRDDSYAVKKIERFAKRFDDQEAYQQLVGYAALPLVLTPELTHYLRQRFLPRLSYVAEVDLLLSELCHEAGYETYIMESGVRAAALGRLRQEGGGERMRQAARLLYNYTLQTAQMMPSFNPYELQAQKWAALAFLDDGRVAKEITEAFCGGVAAGEYRSASAAEFLRLSRLAQELAPELQRYPELIEYAETVTDLLRQPDAVAPERIGKRYRVHEKTLPDLALLTRTSPPAPPQQGREFSPSPSEQRPELAEGREQGVRSETLEVGSTYTEPITGMEFVWIPPGRFMMGSPESEKNRSDDEGPVHEVHFDRGFYMGKYPVIQAEWRKIMGSNPSRFEGERRPVENVSWNDCQEFLRKLNEAVVGAGSEPVPTFRLPSEAEWEYACRAETQTAYYFGDDPAQLGDYAWYWENSDGQTHPVGQKRSNAWGLHDMHGNVWEWCEDAWHFSYHRAPANSWAWISDANTTPFSGITQVLRGASWKDLPRYLRSANRSYDEYTLRHYTFGFRAVLFYV